jgi:hypothetical protein
MTFIFGSGGAFLMIGAAAVVIIVSCAIYFDEKAGRLDRARSDVDPEDALPRAALLLGWTRDDDHGPDLRRHLKDFLLRAII